LDNEKGDQMATWIWIVIAGAAVVVLAALVFGARRAKDRRVAQQREQAQELRQEAERRHRSAKERESLSQELADRAKAERKAGDEAAAHAARVDPDRDRAVGE
jgi:flagellar biosynthesis/type III secretory pathway M-ring protein FliF/YscJ